MSKYLAAEYLGATDIAALTAKNIVFYALELEESNKIVKNRVHLEWSGRVPDSAFGTTAVDDDAGTANKSCIITGEKQHDFGDIDRLAETLRR